MGQESKKILFLDRDGVINKKASEHTYIDRIEDFIFNEGIFDVVARFIPRGYEIIIITNQRGISRGLVTENDLAVIHQYMINGFAERGISILDIFYCPHGNDECVCRKPKDGMLRKACAKYDIDLKESILISDSESDVLMGKLFGIGKNVFVISDEIRSTIT